MSNVDRRLSATLREARAAINLLVEDAPTRRALHGHATAFVTVESNAGALLRRSGSGFIGPFQMNQDHATAIRNDEVGVKLREILMAQERLPPAQRNPDAQILLNAGATRGPWTVSGRDMYQDQGVLGAVSTVIAARHSSQAAGQPIAELSAAQVWMSHKLGWYGGAAVVAAAENDTRTPIGQVQIPEADGQRINMRHIHSNFTGVSPRTSVGEIMERTEAKFSSKVHPDIMSRLSPADRRLFAEATEIPAARIEQAAQRTVPETQVAAATPDRETIIGRQQALIAAGHDLGPRGADGVWGRRSQQADAAYKQATGRSIAEATTTAPATTVAQAPAAPLPATAPLEHAGDGRRQATGKPHLDKALNVLGLSREIEVDALRHAQGVSRANPEQLQTALRDNIRTVQRELRTAGFNAGPVDGLVGERTEQALSAYRQKHGAEPAALQKLRASTTPNAATLQAAIPLPPDAGVTAATITAQIQREVRQAGLNSTGTRGGEDTPRSEPVSPTQVASAKQAQEQRGARAE